MIGEGKMYYFGRADEAREHFERLGYRPSPRQTTADFLVSGTYTRFDAPCAEANERSI